jgi:hypothetical protein
MAAQREYSERQDYCGCAESIGNADSFRERAPERGAYGHASL